MLKNKFAVVTGASTGIGRAVALALGGAGATVFLVARSKDRLVKVQDEILKTGGQAEILVADLSKIDSINRLIETLKAKTSRIDVLANIAGIWHGEAELYADKDFASFQQQVIIDTYMVGIIAPTLLAHGLIPLMPQKAKIINLSGTFENGAKGWLPYFVSKRALEDLTIGLAEELKDKDIQVNAVSPSDTATDAYKKYFPQYIDEAINPEEIAKYTLHLCSAEASHITGKVFVMKKGQMPLEGYHS